MARLPDYRGKVWIGIWCAGSVLPASAAHGIIVHGIGRRATGIAAIGGGVLRVCAPSVRGQ